MKGLPGRFWVLLWLATGATVLGTLGLLTPSVARGGALTPGQALDALLEAASYLTLNGFGPVSEEPGLAGRMAAWCTRLARVCALAFVLTGVGVLVDALLGGIGNWRFHLRVSRPFASQRLDVVCGLAGPGVAFIDNGCVADRAANRWTVAVDPAPSARAVEACLRHGVPLKTADAGLTDLLDRRLDRIGRVFVSTGSDEENLRIVFQLAAAIDDKSRQPAIRCLVHLDDPLAHAPTLRSLRHGRSLDLRTFNAYSVTVRELYRAHALDRFTTPPTNGEGVHLVIVGEGGMADELLLQALQLTVLEVERGCKVDVLCPDPGAAADRWQARHTSHPRRLALPRGRVALLPEDVWQVQRTLPGIRFHALPAAGNARATWCEANSEPGWATTVVVALTDTSAAAALALDMVESLRRLRERADVELWVHVDVAAFKDIVRLFDAADLASNENSGGWIRVFSNYLGACRRDLAVADQIEQAARRVNHVYRMPPDTDIDAWLADDAQLAAHWEDCTELDRDSSRQAAAHAWVKRRILARHGLDDGRPLEGESAAFMAAIEHRRWCAQQLLAGFAPLLACPTSPDASGWNATDLENARAWFSEDGKSKRSWKACYRHLDLMPFDELAHLDAVAAGRGEREQTKDLAVARLIGYIVDGHLPGSNSDLAAASSSGHLRQATGSHN